MRNYTFFDRFSVLITAILSNSFSGVIKILGPVFVLFFYFIILFNAGCFFAILLPIMKEEYSKVTAYIMTAIGVTMLFNIIFNHLLCMIVDPGSLEPLRKAEAKRNLDEFVDDKKSYLCASNELKEVLRYSRKPPSHLNGMWPKICRYCNDLKPVRAHHCSICKKCYFKMDHHCPWVNNCLGLNNSRYFMLFILYAFLGELFMLVVSIMARMTKNTRKYDNPNSILLAFALAIAMVLVLFFFNLWNWYLAFKGHTAIEFWGMKEPKHPGERYNFTFPTIKDNLFLMFGTYSLFKMLLPSMRALPMNGLEFTFESIHVRSLSGSQLESNSLVKKSGNRNAITQGDEEFQGINIEL